MKAKSKGAFAQMSNGLWAIDTKIKIDNEWKHFKKVGYATLSSAKADFERAKAEFIKDNSKHCQVMLFDQVIEQYKKMRAITVDISTQEGDESVYHVYLFPYFKGKLIKEVFNKQSIDIWYHDLVDTTKYSNNKKSKVITRMKDILKFAYMHEYIDAPTYQSCDVCLYQVKYNKRPQTERVVWTKEEEEDFFASFTRKQKKEYLMFKLFFALSPRLGEFLGLQPQCYDYKNKKITIKQQVKNIKGQGAVITDKLKTHESYRTVILSQDTNELLNEYIKTMGLKDNDFLFYGSKKSLPYSRTAFRRYLYLQCEKAKVRKINPHASRHIQAVKLASVCHTGEEIEAAARRLGHSPEMFMNTYARHSSDETERALLERLDA